VKKPSTKAGAAKAASAVDPGRRATQEEALRANSEAFALLGAIGETNLPRAAENIAARMKDGRLSALGVARVAFLQAELMQLPRGALAAWKQALFVEAWKSSPKEQHNRAAALAPKFGWSIAYARRLAKKLRLREKRT
jgi:hypothetical protein